MRSWWQRGVPSREFDQKFADNLVIDDVWFSEMFVRGQWGDGFIALLYVCYRNSRSDWSNQKVDFFPNTDDVRRRFCRRPSLSAAQPARAWNIVGDVKHAQFVLICAVGAALGDEMRPIAK
jgi:hypothetical protein